MADKLTLAAISAFVFVGIIGLLAMTNPPANTIPPTPAYSRITNNGAIFDAENYDSQISLGANHFNTTRMANGVYLDLARNPYAQISDSSTQSCVSGSAKNVTLNTNDEIYRMTHSVSSNTNEIRIDEAGTYLVIAVPQVGEATVQADGIHDFWMMKNNVQVPNSNIKTTVMLQIATTDTMTGTFNWAGRLNQNDIISFQQGCTDSDIGIIATPAGTPPLTPSIIVSVFKVSP